MTRFYDIDDANAAVPELDGDPRDAGDATRGAGPPARRGARAAAGARRCAGGRRRDRPAPAERAVAADDLRLTRLRMQGLIDQMAAGVARIDELGITLRDIERGLVDFPALVNGRQVWLCWRRGEKAIGFWHELDDRVRRSPAAHRTG